VPFSVDLIVCFFYNDVMKKINMAYKFRFYPTKEQEKQLAQAFGCSRFVYNKFLNVKTDSYYLNKEKVGYNQTSNLLTHLKKEEGFTWLNDVSSVNLQQTLRDLDKAFTNFFQKKAEYPTFKKRNSKQSVRYNKSAFTFRDGVVKIAKNKKPLKIKWSRKMKGTPSSVTVSKDFSGRYFASFQTEEEVKELKKIKKSIGIDVGLKDLCVTSDGDKTSSPKYFKKYQDKLAKKQRELSKKVKGSKNRAKARVEVAKVHAKISDCRNDFNQKLTTKLINENQVIAVESLNVKKMMGNKNLSKMIADASWGEIFRMLKYKAEWYGRDLITIDRWFPSSKRCNHCGYINNKLKLSHRNWKCPNCKCNIDRDINAAKNILAVGTTVLAFGESGRLCPSKLE